MKSSSLLLLFIFTVILPPAVQAYNVSADTKHAGYAIHALTSRDVAPDYSEYAKTVWLVSDDDPKLGVNRIVISLADQHLYAYHDQQLVAWSTISSGKSGHETPTGSFTVSEKDVDHHSNLYDDAPMPYFMRLTDEGVGMHAGLLPGYPASHGCIRLPEEMAKALFDHVDSGTPVEITSSALNANVTQTATTTGAATTTAVTPVPKPVPAPAPSAAPATIVASASAPTSAQAPVSTPAPAPK